MCINEALGAIKNATRRSYNKEYTRIKKTNLVALFIGLSQT